MSEDTASALWKRDEGKTTDLYTWVYRERNGQREYLSGTAGRISIALADEIIPLLNLSGATVLNIENKPAVVFVDINSVDLMAMATAQNMPLPEGTYLVGVDPQDGKSVSECLAVEDRERYDFLLQQKLDSVIAAERERCAKIAEQDGEDGGPGDICCDGCHKKSAAQIAARIRSGE